MGLRADTEGDRVAEQRSDPSGDPSGDPRSSARLQKPRLPSSGRPPADPSPSLVPTAARSHQRPGAGANAPERASCTSAPARAIGSPPPQPSRPTPPPTKSGPRLLPGRRCRFPLAAPGQSRAGPESGRSLLPGAANQPGARSRRSPVPGRSMKVEFAPLNIPLARRLQTAAVLQWVLSFLLLGKDPARSRAPRSRPVYSVQGVSVSSLADIPCPRTRLDPPALLSV